MTIRRGYVGPAGAQVHYRTTGSGPTLALLAPTPRSSSYYAALMPQLDDFEVIALDTPGFGLSDPIEGTWSMRDVAERLGAALDELTPRVWHVLGIHSGNKIAAALCSSRPERVDRFVLAGMTHSIVLDNDARNRAMRAFYRSSEAVFDPMATTPVSAAERLAQRWRQVAHNLAAIWASYDPMDDAATARRSGVRAQAVDEVLGFESFDRLYAANFEFDLDGVLRALEVPTVVMEMVVDDEDHLGRQGDLIASVMPHARSVMLSGTDRVLVTRDAGRFSAVIRAALTEPF